MRPTSRAAAQALAAELQNRDRKIADLEVQLASLRVAAGLPEASSTAFNTMHSTLARVSLTSEQERLEQDRRQQGNPALVWPKCSCMY